MDISPGTCVTVGMSGGVDSAVAALLLKEQGCDVTGVFMRNWEDGDGVCPADADYEDVRAVCEHLAVPYYSVNFEREYAERVFSQFLAGLKHGLIPNPDVLCNREIKFASFLDFSLSSGSDLVATGHYVRSRTEGDTVYLLKGLDEGKDQSYFLCLLTQEQLRRTVFPLGEMRKSEVRELAKQYALPVAEKKDSTGICFIGERRFKEFLMQYIPREPGEIRTQDGCVVGMHDGLAYYTPGQRRGLAIGGKKGAGEGRWYVIGRDFEANVLYVSQSEESLYERSLLVGQMHFISGIPSDSFSCTAKVRYRQPDQRAHAVRCGPDSWMVRFEDLQRAAAPGQYCVLYDKDICLGGGVICGPAAPAD